MIDLWLTAELLWVYILPLLGCLLTVISTWKGLARGFVSLRERQVAQAYKRLDTQDIRELVNRKYPGQQLVTGTDVLVPRDPQKKAEWLKKHALRRTAYGPWRKAHKSVKQKICQSACWEVWFIEENPQRFAVIRKNNGAAAAKNLRQKIRVYRILRKSKHHPKCRWCTRAKPVSPIARWWDAATPTKNHPP